MSYPLQRCLWYRAWIAESNHPAAHYGLEMWQRHLVRRRGERPRP